MRICFVFSLCCIFILACQEAKKPIVTKMEHKKDTLANNMKDKRLNMMAILPKFKYKNVKHFTTRHGGYEGGQNLQEMGLERVDSNLLKTFGFFPNMKLYYYAYGCLRNDIYLMAFLGQGMYGLEAFVYVYNVKGELIYHEDKGILDGGDAGTFWKRDIFIDDDSTYRVLQIQYFKKEHGVEKLIDTNSFKMVHIDKRGQAKVLIKRGAFYSP